MKKTGFYVLTLVFLGFGFHFKSFGQVQQCATMELLKEHLAADPTLKGRIQQTEQNAQAWISTNKKSLSTIVRIPTVVHVIHNLSLPDQNIPDSVIFSQIEVLNEDFRRMNADAANTRIIFDSIAADVEVEFCLAKFDILGNVITGINRVTTTKTGFEVFGAGITDMKYTANGGTDAWPRDQYLNIWVCNMTVFGVSGSILGFAQFPGDDAATDGVVIQYNYMGRTADPVQADSSLGRTTTHEIGHWLGLRHIWADDQGFFGTGTCDSSDFVDDTPNQAGQSNYDCDLVINSCSNETPYWGNTDPPDMVENFMDYSSDSCSNMFSMGQKTRMLSFLNTDRLPLLTSAACGPSATFAQSTCRDTCNGEAFAKVIVGNPPYTYSWSTVPIQTNSTAIGLCAGTYTVVITDSLGGAMADTVLIKEYDSLTATVSSIEASCEMCTDGSISASVSGGSGNYNIIWLDVVGNTLAEPTGLSPGKYFIRITDGCGGEVIKIVIVGFYVTVAQLGPQFNFEVFPNPSSGWVTIGFELQKHEYKVQIYDAIGKKVFACTLTGSANLDLSELHGGAYVIRVTSEESIITKKLLLFEK